MCRSGHGEEPTYRKSADQNHLHGKLLVRRLRVFSKVTFVDDPPLQLSCDYY